MIGRALYRAWHDESGVLAALGATAADLGTGFLTDAIGGLFGGGLPDPPANKIPVPMHSLTQYGFDPVATACNSNPVPWTAWQKAWAMLNASERREAWSRLYQREKGETLIGKMGPAPPDDAAMQAIYWHGNGGSNCRLEGADASAQMVMMDVLQTLQQRQEQPQATGGGSGGGSGGSSGGGPLDRIGEPRGTVTNQMLILAALAALLLLK